MSDKKRRRFRPVRNPIRPAAEPGRDDAPPAAARRPSRGVYLLPNLFTTAALFFGFYAIVQAMGGKFMEAAQAIFVAMVLDSMDGRVARMTNTQSEFGAQYDSLADMVSFGAAPALVIYEWSLKGMGKLGWLAAFVYVAGAALRLARFNTNITVVDKRYFQGLPSPAAAGLVAGLVWVATDLKETQWIDWTNQDFQWVAWGLTLFAGLSMVSNVPFYSFKDFNLRRSVPFIVVFLVAVAVVLISQDPPTLLFLIFVSYLVSGYSLFVWRWTRGHKTHMFVDPPATPPSAPKDGAPPAS